MTKRTHTAANRSPRRCLIVERHVWETGFAKEQLQIPLGIAQKFFGTGDRPRPIRVRLADAPSHECPCKVSKKYETSRTRRINGLPFLGLLGACFVFFQETGERDAYELWCQYDMPIVVARFSGWTQGRNSQHGRGRLANIVSAPVDRPIERMSR